MQATLTLEQFEKVILNCIVHYNKGIMVNLPYELVGKCEPFANEIFNYMITQSDDTFIKTNNDIVEKTLLPRCEAQFKRTGLIVNGIRYKNICCMDRYLDDEKVLVAYNPNDVSKIWLIEKGNYIEFDLIEKFLRGKTLEEVENIKNEKNKVINDSKIKSVKSKIKIQSVLDEIIGSIDNDVVVDTKNVRKNRKNEIKKGLV